MTLRDTGWYKSSFSMAGNDNCVEVRHIATGVGVRDSKNPAGRSFRVPAVGWASLITLLTRD